MAQQPINKHSCSSKCLCGLSGETLARHLPITHKQGSAAPLACDHMSLEELKTAPGHPMFPGPVPPELLHSPWNLLACTSPAWEPVAPKYSLISVPKWKMVVAQGISENVNYCRGGEGKKDISQLSWYDFRLVILET